MHWIATVLHDQLENKLVGALSSLSFIKHDTMWFYSMLNLIEYVTSKNCYFILFRPNHLYRHSDLLESDVLLMTISSQTKLHEKELLVMEFMSLQKIKRNFQWETLVCDINIELACDFISTHCDIHLLSTEFYS